MIKTGGANVTRMTIMTAVQGMLGAGMALTRPLPDAQVIPWLLLSGVLHAGYKLFLAYAYEQGDLSRVYPIARGTAPMIVTVVGALVLADRMSAPEYAGVFLLGIGIAVMARGVFMSGESRRLVGFALGSALMTAGYSLADGLGARIAGDAVMYVGWMFALDAVLFMPAVGWLRGTQVFRATRRDLASAGFAALASYGAYAIAVWAMTQAPIALVAALRESSILFAVLIGWLVFGEKMDPGKVLAAGLIVLGMVLTRL